MSRAGLTRRQALSAFGAALVAACGRSPSRSEAPSSPSSPSASGSASGPAPAAGARPDVAAFANAGSCTVAPTQTEGPYHVDVDLIRADIREDRPGTPLRLAARVLAADGCTPVRDAVFEVWHCDAGGLYSGFEQASMGRGGGRDDKRYLRGAQVTDADGIAMLTTVYPGWYGGRTVHVHVKVAVGTDEVLTSQLYFDDAVTDEVYAAAPYTARGPRDTRNDRDGFYAPETTVTVTKDGDGYLGLITIGVAT